MNAFILRAKAHGRTMSARLLACLAACLLMAPLMAQYDNDYPLTGTIDQDQLADGDTIAITFDYGTVSEQVPATDSITFFYKCEGFSIDTARSTFTHDGSSSWYVDSSTTWQATATYIVKDSILQITITRDGTQGGYGEILTTRGIIIPIIEIEEWRQAAPEAEATWQWASYPNPVRDRLTLLSEDWPLESAVVSNLQGRVMAQWTGEQHKVSLSLGHLPAGFYTVTVRQGNQQAVRRLYVRP